MIALLLLAATAAAGWACATGRAGTDSRDTAHQRITAAPVPRAAARR